MDSSDGWGPTRLGRFLVEQESPHQLEQFEIAKTSTIFHVMAQPKEHEQVNKIE
jgi:hypothetical protein